MCQIVCQLCRKPIEHDEETLELLQGFIDKGDFIPEM
jgi:hypothetical protein